MWWPISIFKLEECKSSGPYLTDCFISGYTDSARTRLLTTIKLREEDVVLKPSPPVDATILPRHKCTVSEYSKALRELWDIIQAGLEPTTSPTERRSGWSKHISPERLALAHVLSPVKWITGPMEELKIDIAEDIARSLLRDMLELLCVEKGPPITSWIQAYALLGVNLKKKRVILVYSKKRKRLEVLEKYFFEHATISKELERIIEENST
ncbi:MAG: hypothetical protein ABWW65_00020 [Thermoprotei archaeon]